jgi:hypothetical protein
LLVCALHSIGNGTAIAVKASFSHVCIIRADNTTTATNSGDVLCWGSGDFFGKTGQLVRSTIHSIRVQPVKHRSRVGAFIVHVYTD